MNLRPTSLTAILAVVALVWVEAADQQLLDEYYDIDEDKPLRGELHRIIDDHTRIPYTHSTSIDSVHALKDLDKSNGVDGTLKLIYSRRIEAAAAFPGTWNREHLWPNSYGLGTSSKPSYTDLHNLRPADANVNSSRGNKLYDLSNLLDANYASPAHHEALETSRDTDSWEPPDDVKGDIARALFYMDVRYSGDHEDEPDLVLTNDLSLVQLYTPYFGRLSTLLKWHFDDPVDDSEIERNDLIHLNYQHNRNPFVDYPDWVNTIYENDGLPGTSELKVEKQLDGVVSLVELRYVKTGEELVVSPIKVDGYAFKEWQGKLIGDEAEQSVTIEEDTLIRAVYKHDTSDKDNDGLTAYDEILIHNTDPSKKDTTGDGFSDGELVEKGMKPTTNYAPLLELIKANPETHSLFSADSIQDEHFRLGGVVIEQDGDGFNLTFTIEKSADLKVWTEHQKNTVRLDSEAGKNFLRVRIGD